MYFFTILVTAFVLGTTVFDEAHAGDAVELGMEKVVKSYEMASRWDVAYVKTCKDKMTSLKNKILTKFYFKKKPHRREIFFQEQSKELIKNLPKTYQDKCLSFLEKPNTPPSADESALLGDSGTSYPFKGYAHCLLSTLRKESNGIMEKDADALMHAIDKINEAYDMVCAYEKEVRRNCNGQQKFISDQILGPQFKNNQDQQEKYLGPWSMNPLKRLPSIYESTCSQYLDREKRYASAPADETAVLKDKKYYPYRAYMHCLINTLRKVSKGKMERTTKHVAYGVEKSEVAYEKVCKHEPDSWKCKGQSTWMKSEMLDREDFKGNANLQEEYFGKWTKDMILPKLSKIYVDKCGKYLDDSELLPPSNESGFLKDTDIPEYPYKGYNHCLIRTLKERNGGRIP